MNTYRPKRKQRNQSHQEDQSRVSADVPEEICSVFQIERTNMNLQMQLLTMEIAQHLPKNDDIVNLDDAVAQCHFFMPGTGLDWYVLAGQQAENGEWNFIGYATCGCDSGEFCGFTLSQLEDIEGPFGLKVERDLYFAPTAIKEVINGRAS